jgi:hypothetical protein
MFASTTTPTTPRTEELFNRRQLAARHPHLLSEHRIAWAVRNREKNGLTARGATFDSPCGEILIHEPAFLAWFLGLKGPAKPRRARRAQSAGSAV